MPTGLSEHHTTFGDTLTLTLPTLHAPLRDNRRSVIRVGFSRILIVNGRGGNMTALNALTSELTAEPVTRETSMTMAAFPEPIRAEHLAESRGPRIILPTESTEPVYVATGPGRSPEASTSMLVSRAMRCWSSSWVVRQSVTAGPKGISTDSACLPWPRWVARGVSSPLMAPHLFVLRVRTVTGWTRRPTDPRLASPS
ncbi:creatininase family protein [Streptomyces sp. NPDC004232]|uniref:creatininase family protein n=1 Tax=Streptomyces sp. NPDC004232 TaxID=3154454 RepID=UPI0033B64B0B